MRTSIQTPTIIRFAYTQEPGDADYGSCLWAYYDFDTANGILNVQSDCGYYHYRWPESGDEFRHLMAKIDSDYLMEKLLMSVNRPGKAQKAWARCVAEIYEQHVQPVLMKAWGGEKKDGEAE